MQFKIILSYASFGILVGLLASFFSFVDYELILWILFSIIAAKAFKQKINKYLFLHTLIFGSLCGLLTGITEVIFLDSFLTNNPELKASLTTAPFSVQTLLLFTGLFYGIALGVIVFLLSFLFPKMNE